MNNITPLVAQQVAIMLILIVVGFILTKAKLITTKGSKDISNILLTIVTPALLICAYQIDFDMSVVKDLAIAFFLAFVTHLVFIIICRFVYLKVKDEYKRKVIKFTNIYSNAGFMGIPLLAATLGSEGVLLGSAYLAMFNIIVWTHGIYLYSEDFGILSAKQLLKNPGILGVTIALLLFFFRVRLSGVIWQAVSYVADLNTPLAMILLGTYLANSNLKKAFSDVSIYGVCFTRLIVLPVIIIFLFRLLNVEYFMAISLILPAACPCAAMAAIYAQKFDFDPGYPSQIVSVTTIVSLITLPAISFVASLVLGG